MDEPIVHSNPVEGLNRQERSMVFYSDIRGLYANLDELAVLLIFAMCHVVNSWCAVPLTLLVQTRSCDE